MSSGFNEAIPLKHSRCSLREENAHRPEDTATGKSHMKTWRQRTVRGANNDYRNYSKSFSDGACSDSVQRR